MRMLSAPVLAGAVLASSPALYQGFITRTVPMEDAGSRFAVALVIAWLAMSAVAMLVGEPPKPVPAAEGSSADAAVDAAVDAAPATATVADPAPIADTMPLGEPIGELSAGPSASGGGATQAA
ncbi:MAG TPA: hypothetical protein VMF51_01580 [Nocardioides sp.]|uniref:hypothetical protein n=1 Tax=Nocardioides sp. TaxID=35761 RepID=UPI002B5E36BE|nr:hypothetical protein [Nocardioides sp.]HTW13785.1 hypothetical protein [Nocardioides sp.]